MGVPIEKDRGWGHRPPPRRLCRAVGPEQERAPVSDGLPWCAAATLSLDKVCAPSLVMFILTALSLSEFECFINSYSETISGARNRHSGTKRSYINTTYR